MSLEDSPTPFKRRSYPQGLRFSAYSRKVVCIWWSGRQETKVARDEEEQSRRSQKTGAKVEGGCKISCRHMSVSAFLVSDTNDRSMIFVPSEM